MGGPPRQGEGVGECLPFPDAWLGDWGTQEGISVTCGGMAGRCEMKRVNRVVEFSLTAPDLLSGNKVCLRLGPSIFGSAYFIDAWPGDAVQFNGDSISRSENHPDGYGHGYVRLSGEAPAPVVPAWAVGDFEFPGAPGKPTLQTGANAVWVVQGKKLGFMSGRLVMNPSDATCVTLAQPSYGGALEGILCQRDGQLEFTAKTSRRSEAEVFRTVRRTSAP